MFAQRPPRTTGLLHRRGSSLDYNNHAPSSDSPPRDEDFVQDAHFFSKQLDTLSAPKRSMIDRRSDMLRLVDVYYIHAATKAKNIRERLHESSSQDSMELDDPVDPRAQEKSLKSLVHWESEAQTWDLLRRLLPLRGQDANSGAKFHPESGNPRLCSDLWQEFLEADPTARERKAVLESLQDSADSSRIDIDELVRENQHRADRGDIIAFGWIHTRSAIKKQKTISGWAGALDPHAPNAGDMLVDGNETDPLVTQLDPDVPTRQGRKLQPQDEFFERAIWLGCYELLRRGSAPETIQNWCMERTELWRAVSMSAMPLSKSGQGVSSCEPLSVLLWRRTCFALARQGGNDDYERAVYGILSGDISSVEKVCDSWDDFVFAHYNALLRSQFDSYVMKRSPADSTAAVTQSFSTFNAVQFHGSSASVRERLMSTLESNPKTALEARTPMKSLQAAIISDNLDQYIYELGLALGRRANKNNFSPLVPAFDSDAEIDDSRFFSADDHSGMRLLAHVYLVLSSLQQDEDGVSLGQPDRHSAQENILSTYVSTLRLNDLVEMVPLYCSRLQGERAFFTLSRNLTRVTDFENRDMLLRIMEKLGIDIANFVKYQPQSFLQQCSSSEQSPPALARFTVFSNEPPSLKYGRPLKPDFFGDIPEQLPPAEENLIQSLEWFMLVNGLWDEIFQTGTAIYKLFLKNFNLHAARCLSERVPCAEIFRRKAGWNIPDDADVSWFDDFRAGIANGAYEDNNIGPHELAVARSFFEMECLVRALDSMETIASSEGIAKDPADEVGRDFWTEVGEEVKRIKSFMRPVLGNWLSESLSEDEDFELLRNEYLPETVIGYISVLHFAGTSLSRDNLLECMELAALIAQKDSDLQGVLMRSGRMKEMVEGFANCSKALAISGGDKKGAGAASKKMREMGWTRELWSVK